MSTTQTLWLVIVVIMFFLLLGIGMRITGRPLGILIDSRKKMSLSRFQVVMWNWLIISAFFAAAIVNQTLNIELDPEIWALMGISMGSTAGAIVIKGNQAAKQPAKQAASKAGTPVNQMGVLHEESDVKKAALSNMFKGEEITDYDYVDITKVQMFFFTIALLIGYAYLLWGVFQGLPGDTSPETIKFPSLSTALVTLIGISHAGYLTAKAAPKTPTKTPSV